MNKKVGISVVKKGDAPAAVQPPKVSSLPEQLRILSLSDCVLFPGMVVPLLIDDPLQVRLVDEVINDNGYMGVTLLRKPVIGVPRAKDLYRQGCLARIQRMVSTEKSQLRILVEGIQCFESTRFIRGNPDFPVSEVTYLEDVLEEDFKKSSEYQALGQRLSELVSEFAKVSPALPEDIKIASQNTTDPALLSNLIAFALPIPLQEKQQLLSKNMVQVRIRLLIQKLNREIQSAQLGAKILKDTSVSLSKTQRENYLREQLRSIHKELGDEGSAEVARLQGLIKKNQLSSEALQVAHHEINRLQVIPFSSPEYAGIRNYLDWLVNLPWNKEDTNRLNLSTAKRLLNRNHYGLNEIKERLLEYLAVMKLKGMASTPILCLVGPPGVGKTSLGQSVAEALGRKFCRIALGGARDVAEIRGHRRTYVSAQPGRIIQNLRRLGTRNPVILFDEIDKVGSGTMGGETASALLEILDPRQNASFTDSFLEVPFDLSRVLFITTANWLDPIHPALRDRMEIIEIPGYTFCEKYNIALRHTVPDLLKQHGLPEGYIDFQEPALRLLIQSYTYEGGVRGMERQIAALFRKIVRQRMQESPNSTIDEKAALLLSSDDVAGLLGPPLRLNDPLELGGAAGFAMGLACTPQGGEVIPVEVTRMTGSGQIILTGNLGEVLRESIRIALSFLRSEESNLNLDMSKFHSYDIHVHLPTGSVPKDGPSAGLTFAVALASLFSNRKVRLSLSMSGEVSLRGYLLPVSGIREKALAAGHLGIAEVLLPKANESDWRDLPAALKRRVKAKFFEHATDAIRYALSM
ncbi:MAG: endopeptidase La [Verrucomicrobiota bacterium]|nr:endopeptidase La [Verrucomicrobiota bacterium]